MIFYLINPEESHTHTKKIVGANSVQAQDTKSTHKNHSCFYTLAKKNFQKEIKQFNLP